MNESQQPTVESTSPTSRHFEGSALAASKLRHSGYLAVQHLICEFHAGVLTVRGCLPSYYLKQVALAAVATVEGVQHIDDQIEVAAHAPRSAASTGRP